MQFYLYTLMKRSMFFMISNSAYILFLQNNMKTISFGAEG